MCPFLPTKEWTCWITAAPQICFHVACPQPFFYLTLSISHRTVLHRTEDIAVMRQHYDIISLERFGNGYKTMCPMESLSPRAEFKILGRMCWKLNTHPVPEDVHRRSSESGRCLFFFHLPIREGDNPVSWGPSACCYTPGSYWPPELQSDWPIAEVNHADRQLASDCKATEGVWLAGVIVLHGCKHRVTIVHMTGNACVNSHCFLHYRTKVKVKEQLEFQFRV